MAKKTKSKQTSKEKEVKTKKNKVTSPKKKAKKQKKAPKKTVKKTKSTTKQPESLLKTLLEAGCHFGHKKSKIHPKAKKNLYTVRDGIAIFDLIKTKDCLEEAKKFVSKLVKSGGKIVFLGTKRQAKEIVREEAEQVGMPFITNRWLGGTITNWEQIKLNSIDRFNDLKKKFESGEFKDRTKKEQSVIKKEINRLRRIVGGLSGLDQIFGALFVVDIKTEKTAINEARDKGIPVIAIVDSNCDPELVDYPIPANDDAAKSIQLLVSEIAKVIKEAKKK